MARVRDPAPAAKSPRQTRNAAKADVIPKPATTKKATKKATSKAKGSLDALATAEESEELTNTVRADANARKRTHEDNDMEDALPATSKKARKTPAAVKAPQEASTPPPPARRSTRPQTTKPAIEGKRKRRSKAQKAADDAEAEAKKKQEEELARENQRIMAQMNANEDLDRAKTRSRATRTFTEIENDAESGEEFLGFNDVSSDSDDEEEDVGVDSDEAMDVEKLKKANKEMQNVIKALKAKAGGGKKKGAGGKKSAKKVTFASGLRPGWDDDIKKSSEEAGHVQISAGGLNDSDAEDVNPFPLPAKSHPGVEPQPKGSEILRRDSSRKNDMIVSVEVDDKENAPPRPRGKKVAVKPAKPAQKTSKTAPVRIESSQEAPLPKNSKKKGDDAKTDAKKEKRLNGNISSDPFGDFCVGTPAFVKILQIIVKEVYPDIDYTVTSTDSIHFLAYNRVNEKRSSIGSNAIKLLEAHVSTLKGEQAVKEWLRWCIWPGGPLLFRVPSPIHSEEPPEGRLLSPFVIALAGPLLGLKTGSASENGPPQGLIALIAAALERAARHLYSPNKKLKEFSKEAWGSHVEAYWKSFQPDDKLKNEGVKPERWQELTNMCLSTSDDKEESVEDIDADLAILDDRHYSG